MTKSQKNGKLRDVTEEEKRLEESRLRVVHWKRWGPFLSERQWGTVREDYSANGTAWDYFPHDHARSRAYRWGEDGLGGISDRHQLICFALALWNGKDPILKERLFGLTGSEGNHGEDVKEYYFYLDSTPTHSYMKFLYKYPQSEFPYTWLVNENRSRGKHDPEFELMDTGIFDEDGYFDIVVEYAKATAEDILILVTAFNRGRQAAELHILPTLWFRNIWSWNHQEQRPTLNRVSGSSDTAVVEAFHQTYQKRWLLCEGTPEVLFTDNETNNERLFGSPNNSRFVKDAINDYIVHGARCAVNPAETGTKCAAHYAFEVEAGASAAIRLRLTDQPPAVVRRSAPAVVVNRVSPFDKVFDEIFETRRREANEFYAKRAGSSQSEDAIRIQRQAFAGMLWSKQFYHCDIKRWLEGDPTQPLPPRQRQRGRNHEWGHLYNEDVISMPDKWEYPWYASWDLAFHCVTLATIDPDFAKEQILLFLREWYMHPNGQLPAYEWALGDVNPPVHAWAAWRVYKIEKRIRGHADRKFLARAFQKLLLNFTWWINRKDPEGMNVFQGGFLGLDNIGVFDRSAPLPTGGHIEQSDGTSWMGMYCLNMLAIALELAKEDNTYGDLASKFFEHFVYIAEAMNNRGGERIELWDPEDGFFYDVLHLSDDNHHFLKVRSMVGLIPLFAVETLEPELVDALPGFKKRMLWFVENRPELRHNVTMLTDRNGRTRRLLSIVSPERLPRVLQFMLDEREFLSPYGIRALSRFHFEHPYILRVDDHEYRVDYQPAESDSGLFGGNSNWRGPIWFPLNFLLVESLQKFHHFLGEQFKVQCPTGSGQQADLWHVATDLSRRLIRIFLRDGDRRPVYGGQNKFQVGEHWRDLIQFHEYFHGDNGAGVGASHQTGWTGLVAKLIEQSGE